MRRVPRKHSSTFAAQIRKARALLREFDEILEDLEDIFALQRAKKRNGNKPGIPWETVAKELGIKPPPRKR